MTENNYIEIYSSSHQNKKNQLIHFICVPIIFFNVMAFIYYFSPLWLTCAVIIATLFFYFKSMPSFFLLMVMLHLFSLLICYLFATSPFFVKLNIIMFIAAWIGQFVGHKIEGKKPSFFQDLLFLLVGPAWIMEKIWRKIN